MNFFSVYVCSPEAQRYRRLSLSNCRCPRCPRRRKVNSESIKRGCIINLERRASCGTPAYALFPGVFRDNYSSGFNDRTRVWARARGQDPLLAVISRTETVHSDAIQAATAGLYRAVCPRVSKQFQLYPATIMFRPEWQTPVNTSWRGRIRRGKLRSSW